MKLQAVLDMVDKIKPGNPYDVATKIQWLNELEGDIQSRLLKTAPQEIIQYTENDLEETLLVPVPHDKVYWMWVAAMIDFANGEYQKYQNTLQMVNDAYDKYAKWFHRHFHQDTGGFLYIGGTTKYGLSAYEIALNHGFVGTVEDWLDSLEGRQGPVGEGLNIVDMLGSEAELPDSDGLKPGTGYLVGNDADALLFIWNGEEWFFKKSLRGAAGYTPKRGVDYWTTEDQSEIRQSAERIATAAAQTATNAAEQANTAAESAGKVVSNAETAAKNANEAAYNAGAAAGNAQVAAGNAAEAANAANAAAGNVAAAENAANTAAGNASTAADSANRAASAANTAAGNANTAAGAANAAAQSASNAETELRNAAAAGDFDGDTGPAGVVYGPDEPTDPSHPVWIDTSGNDENPYLMVDQGAENAGKILGINDEGKVIPMDASEGGNDTPGADGGYYTPAVEQVDSTTMRVSFAASKEDMPAVEAQNIVLPAGPAGNDATVTTENIKKALGYTPADAEDVRSLSAEIGDLQKVSDVSVSKLNGDKIQQFSALFNNTENIESFIFFTDPHTLNGNTPEKIYNNVMPGIRLIKKYSEITPTTFVLSGGDWLNSGDTYDLACTKLGILDGVLRKNFKRHYFVIGNHDTNSQGVDDTGATNTGVLSNETLKNLLFRDYGKSYYSFNGSATKFYVLDTGLGWANTLTERCKKQLLWLATSLAEDDAPHSAIAMHIVQEGGVSSGQTWDTALSVGVRELVVAYNNRQTYENGESVFDFSECTGRMEFIIGGHTHLDVVKMIDGIPLIMTTNLLDGNTPTFDLCLVDYDNRIIHFVRIGTGTDRIVELFSTGYTNVIPTSLDPMKDGVYNEVGYKDGVRLDSEQVNNYEAALANHVLTGLIEYPINTNSTDLPTIYVKGNASFTSSDPGSRIGFYPSGRGGATSTIPNIRSDRSGDNGLFTHVVVTTIAENYWAFDFVKNGDTYAIADYLTKLSGRDYHERRYIQLSMSGTGEGLIVSIGNPIE